MMWVYYRIWMDFIHRVKLQPVANRRNWKLRCMISMTLAMAFNLVLVMTILEKFVFKRYFYKIEFPYLPVRVNNVLSYLILFILPCALMNYLLIFRNDRYEKLLNKYPYYNGKLFISYFLISMFLPIILMWAGIVFSKINSA
ncbi:MAG: hypothetical protein BGO31_15615 [Bacteroidetes bacterium 43-16]|nr:MAG: hypothetical protein BGO31_15615 [Bacteroidetes bacterium 43-16]